MGKIVLNKMTKKAAAERRRATHIGERGGRYIILKSGKKRYTKNRW